MVKFKSFSVKDPVMILGKEKFLRIFLSTTLKFWGTLDAGMCSSRSISNSTGAVKEKRGNPSHTTVAMMGNYIYVKM